VTDDLDEPALPGDDAHPLEPDEAATWAVITDRVASLAHRLREGGEVGQADLTLPDIDIKRVLNALHVPDDAGPHAADLERILRRIPDGWGRWIGCGKGWYPLIIDLDHRLAALDPTYWVHQVKEKYGTLRYYIAAHGSQAATMEAMVDQAEIASETICETCGEPGVLMAHDSWLKTLCDTCGRATGYRPAQLGEA
jgi:hypothetical protein